MTALTGMPTAAACFLLPIGVVLYTIAGGIKATFLTDYVHTVMILIIIFIFVSPYTQEIATFADLHVQAFTSNLSPAPIVGRSVDF